jgi:SAM-dependent methyltransferase
MQIYEGSIWRDTWTCFPDAQRLLHEVLPDRRWDVLILGCGDGKHTIPFVRAGHRVLALDDDPATVNGGRFEFLGQTVLMNPLFENMEREGLPRDRVHLELVDYMRYTTDEQFDVVLTSCSWQFRRNWRHPIASIIRKVQSFTRPGGVVVADYMQPHDAKYKEVEHYLSIEQMRRFFDEERWLFLLHRDDGVVRERHVNGEAWHEHRYASLVVQRRTGGAL